MSPPHPLSSRIPAHSYAPPPSFPVPSYPSLFWGSFPPCFFSLFPLITLLCSPCPAPVYKSRMYTVLRHQLRFFVQVSAIRRDFDLFPKDLYIISPRQGRSIVQARLVHRGPTVGGHPPGPSYCRLTVPLPCSLLPRAGVQVSYVHRSAPPVAFLCTSLSDKARFRPFSERLVHNITTAGTFHCTSQTCT